MDRHARGLVDDDQVRILEQYRQRDRLGGRFGGHRRGDFDPVGTGLRLGRGVGHGCAGVADPPLDDQRLQAGSRQLRGQARQHLVDPAAGGRWLHRDDADVEGVGVGLDVVRFVLAGHLSPSRFPRGR